MLHAGIDEAGYGPTLGPLVVATVWAEAADHDILTETLRATGVRDSKDIHKPRDLAPLETVTLAGCRWAIGHLPATAAEMFSVLGETPADRDQPWMQGAEELVLPVAADSIPVWTTPGVLPGGCAGRIVHPAAYNRFLATGANKAELELDAVGRLLVAPPPAAQRNTVVDRLGGRKFYRDFLASVHPGALVLVEDEANAASRYRICRDAGEHAVAFVVGGESASPLTALASCLAKYVRELHMLLFNRYWCAHVPGLAATAGYPEDAKRWLHEVGSEAIRDMEGALVRGVKIW
jgi:ribonuclease HII